jgi:hypothetical protein
VSGSRPEAPVFRSDGDHRPRRPGARVIQAPSLLQEPPNRQYAHRSIVGPAGHLGNVGQSCTGSPANFTPTAHANTTFSGETCATISVPQGIVAGYLELLSTSADQISVSGTISTIGYGGINLDSLSSANTISINHGANIITDISGIINYGSINSISLSGGSSIITDFSAIINHGSINSISLNPTAHILTNVSGIVNHGSINSINISAASSIDALNHGIVSESFNSSASIGIITNYGLIWGAVAGISNISFSNANITSSIQSIINHANASIGSRTSLSTSQYGIQNISDVATSNITNIINHGRISGSAAGILNT